jgi:rhodanese-related sulfurtransferase
MTEELSPDRVAELVESGQAQVIDVREPYEHEAGHLAGDRHVELPDLAAEAATLDRERPVVVYCRTGSRAATAVDALRASGWDAYNLEGGLVAWIESGHPVEPENGIAAGHSPLP